MQARKVPAGEAIVLSIGRLSQATGTSPDTIRYYERLGLLPRPPRGTGRQRAFGPEHLQRLLFVRRARALGFTLEDIASLLTLAAPGRRSCASVRALAAKHLNDVRSRLAAPPTARALAGNYRVSMHGGHYPGVRRPVDARGAARRARLTVPFAARRNVLPDTIQSLSAPLKHPGTGARRWLTRPCVSGGLRKPAA